MSLMDDFELGKLKNGWYWVLTPDSIKPFPAFCFRGKFDGCDGQLNDCVSEVIALCKYDHFVELTEKVKNLSSENENLLNLTANQDKEIETLKEDQEKMVRGAKRMLDFQSQTIEQLRQLLKDSIYILNEYKHYFDVKHHNMMANIIDKANEVLNG